MHQFNDTWASERQTSLLPPGSDDTFTLFCGQLLITPPLLTMRSPALSTLFLTLFFLLFSV